MKAKYSVMIIQQLPGNGGKQYRHFPGSATGELSEIIGILKEKVLIDWEKVIYLEISKDD